MALKRYIGPYDAVEVKVAGRELGIVEKDGSIVVPDELAELVAWSPELWEDGAPKPVAKPDAPKDGDK